MELVQECNFKEAEMDKVRAFVDITFKNGLKVYGAKIVETDKGVFVGLPQNQGKDKKYYAIVKMVDKEDSALLNDEVLELYEQHINGKRSARTETRSESRSTRPETKSEPREERSSRSETPKRKSIFDK